MAAQKKLFAGRILVAFFTGWLCFCGSAVAGEWPQWLGPNRDNKSQETGLLKKWPEGGPKLLWSVDGLGDGWASVSIADGLIYTTGKNSKTESVYAIELTGKKKWQTESGPAWTGAYPSARCAPTFDEGRLYVTTGSGTVTCLDAKTGQVKWTVDAFGKFKGSHGRWGTAESPLIYDNMVFYMPGGNNTTVVAIDKMTGRIIWASAALDDNRAYVSPILVERGDRKIIVGVTANYIIGVDARDGTILWKYDYVKKHGKKRGADINTTTPLYHDGNIYVTSGYDHVGVMLKLSEDGKDVSLKWVDETLDCHHGGVVFVDGYIYGASWKGNGDGNWVCLDWDTGKVMYDTHWINKGAISYADGMLYCYEEKKGNVALVRATPEKFDIVSSFAVTKGTGEHWALPVISGGRLYIRHGEVLMAYDIKAH